MSNHFGKSVTDSSPINAGYMVFNPEIFNYLEGDQTVLEREPLIKLASEGELMSYMNRGFWQCMDTTREKNFGEIFEYRNCTMEEMVISVASMNLGCRSK